MSPDDLPFDWPYRAQGRVLRAGPHDWWLLDVGPAAAPPVLLLHGLGASGHSFARLIAALVPRFRVIVPDLPGQGCTRAGRGDRLGLEPMAQDLLALTDALDLAPVAVVGHSAGGALGMEIASRRPLRAVVGINAALGRFPGPASVLFPMLARGLASVPFLSHGLSRFWGDPDRVDRLLSGTGSALDEAGRARYARLVQDPDHVAGALGMMAQWSLDGLMRRIPAIRMPCLLIAGQSDRTVPPQVARDTAARLTRGTALDLPGGHLIHEEPGNAAVERIADWLGAELRQPGRPTEPATTAATGPSSGQPPGPSAGQPSGPSSGRRGRVRGDIADAH